MKKCPRCDSISSDTENSCGVCGGSLSDIASESLEKLVHKEPEIRPRRKLNWGAIAVITIALTMTGVGGFLLVVLLNVMGILLLFAGLGTMLYMAGGVGIGIARGVRSKRAMQTAEDRRIEEELKRKRGEKD